MATFLWRPLAPGELDHERLWLGVGSAGALAAAAAWHTGFRLPRCTFHWLTGYPCPGCGSTRAVLQLVQGKLGAAFAFNPLITTLAVLGFVWAIYAAVVVIARLPRLRPITITRRQANRWLAGLVASVAGNWWWVLAHGW